jgi:malonate transporter and related proteins
MNSSTAILGLASALAQLSAVILFGYVAARTDFIKPSAAAGIGQLVGRAALPALLFKAIATADLGEVDPKIVAAHVLSKLVVLAVAVLVGLKTDRSEGGSRRWLTAGAYGLFVVNSNDLALGVPMFTALYDAPTVTYVDVFAD